MPSLILTVFTVSVFMGFASASFAQPPRDAKTTVKESCLGCHKADIGIRFQEDGSPIFEQTVLRELKASLATMPPDSAPMKRRVSTDEKIALGAYLDSAIAKMKEPAMAPAAPKAEIDPHLEKNATALLKKSCIACHGPKNVSAHLPNPLMMEKRHVSFVNRDGSINWANLIDTSELGVDARIDDKTSLSRILMTLQNESMPLAVPGVAHDLNPDERKLLVQWLKEIQIRSKETDVAMHFPVEDASRPETILKRSYDEASLACSILGKRLPTMAQVEASEKLRKIASREGNEIAESCLWTSTFRDTDGKREPLAWFPKEGLKPRAENESCHIVCVEGPNAAPANRQGTARGSDTLAVSSLLASAACLAVRFLKKPGKPAPAPTGAPSSATAIERTTAPGCSPKGSLFSKLSANARHIASRGLHFTLDGTLQIARGAWAACQLTAIPASVYLLDRAVEGKTKPSPTVDLASLVEAKADVAPPNPNGSGNEEPPKQPEPPAEFVPKKDPPPEPKRIDPPRVDPPKQDPPKLDLPSPPRPVPSVVVKKPAANRLRKAVVGTPEWNEAVNDWIEEKVKAMPATLSDFEKRTRLLKELEYLDFDAKSDEHATLKGTILGRY